MSSKDVNILLGYPVVTKTSYLFWIGQCTFFYDSFSKKSPPQDLDSMILLMTKWVYDFNSQQLRAAIYTLIDISFPLSQVVFLMCVSLTNGPIGSENHHLEMACRGKYPNKGSGFWLGHPFWSVGGLHLIHRRIPLLYYIPPRVVGLLPDRPPEVSHMAYCCVMGTTGLDEKMYNIIGHRGLRLV